MIPPRDPEEVSSLSHCLLIFGTRGTDHRLERVPQQTMGYRTHPTKLFLFVFLQNLKRLTFLFVFRPI